MSDIDTRAEAIEAAGEACLTSDDLTTRALDWAGVYADRHAALVELVVAYYIESPEFATWVVDVADEADVA